jgi:hypothetical protein
VSVGYDKVIAIREEHAALLALAERVLGEPVLTLDDVGGPTNGSSRFKWSCGSRTISWGSDDCRRGRDD